jgi:hypothetical protein
MDLTLRDQKTQSQHKAETVPAAPDKLKFKPVLEHFSS